MKRNIQTLMVTQDSVIEDKDRVQSIFFHPLRFNRDPIEPGIRGVSCFGLTSLMRDPTKENKGLLWVQVIRAYAKMKTLNPKP